jgi:NADP-dependent 3-hydroxy acid dehydrogenase YdfG
LKLLDGKIAMVTGASRGIGLAISDLLFGNGAHVIRLARSLTPQSAERCTDLACDVTNEDEVRKCISQVISQVGVPDIVVNNAGTFMLKPLVETSRQQFERSLSVNLMGPFLILRELLPRLIKHDRAHIVTIGSIADHVPFPGNAAYGASKYGLRGLHEVLKRELNGTDVRTTLISPGPTDTTLWDELSSDEEGDLVDRADMLQVDDVAEAVLFAVTRPPRANVDVIHISPAV